MIRKERCECLKLEGIVQTILARGPTGYPTDDDIGRAALDVYNGDATVGKMYMYIGEPFYNLVRRKAAPTLHLKMLSDP